MPTLCEKCKGLATRPPYTTSVDQNQAIEKARQFARTAYAGQVDEIVRAHQQQIVEVRARLAAQGTLMSGTQVVETSRINGDQIKALTVARVDAILAGYELHGIGIDDSMAVDICDEVIQGMNQMVHSSKGTSLVGLTGITESLYPNMLAQAVGVNAAWVKTRIDRRRLMAKKNEGSTTIYNVQGDNARWSVNSTDNSVNVITKSSEEFFADLRGRIDAEVPEGDERRKIVESLAALQESHGKPAFAQRYTDFMAAAANHIKVIAPFIPALTEMLHHVLK
jgi:hypothetical protein